MIIIPIDGITEYDTFGNMKKYFIEIPEIYVRDEAVIEAKRQEVIAQYERDKQDAERKKILEEAEYIQAFQIVKKSKNHPSNKNRNLLHPKTDKVIELYNGGFTALVTILEAAKGSIIRDFKKAELARIFQETNEKTRQSTKQGTEGDLTEKLQRFIINLCKTVTMSPNAKVNFLKKIEEEIKNLETKGSKD